MHQYRRAVAGWTATGECGRAGKRLVGGRAEATVWGLGSPPGSAGTSAHPAVQPHSPYRSCHLATTNRAASRGGDDCFLEVNGWWRRERADEGGGGAEVKGKTKDKHSVIPSPSPHPQHTPPTPTPASTLVPAEHERAQAKLGGGAGAGVGVWWEGEGGSERKGQQGSGGWLEQDVLGGH